MNQKTNLKTDLTLFKLAPIELKFFLFFVFILFFLDLVLMKMIDDNLSNKVRTILGGSFMNFFYMYSSIMVSGFIFTTGPKKINKTILSAVVGFITFGLILYTNNQIDFYNREYINSFKFVWNILIPAIWIFIFLFSPNIRAYIKKSNISM